MAQTQEEYYENEDNFGKYQYVPLSEVVNAMVLETQDDGSFLKGTKRTKILYHAKQGLRNLSKNVASDVRGYEITVPDDLVWALPQDYVRNLKIFLVQRNEGTGNLDLLQLQNSPNMFTEIGYLQDNDAELLYDDEGNILEADSSNSIAQSYNSNFSSPSAFGNRPTKDMSKYSNYGDFAFDEARGIIVFSSNLIDKEVVIRYQSDGLQAELSDSEVLLHKDLKEALESYIYHKCIARKRNELVPANEKHRANNEFKTLRHKAAISRAKFDLLRIANITDASTKIF